MVWMFSLLNVKSYFLCLLLLSSVLKIRVVNKLIIQMTIKMLIVVLLILLWFFCSTNFSHSRVYFGLKSKIIGTGFSFNICWNINLAAHKLQDTLIPQINCSECKIWQFTCFFSLYVFFFFFELARRFGYWLSCLCLFKRAFKQTLFCLVCSD